MRVTVFGANGSTGRRTVDELVARGHDAVAVVRDPARHDGGPHEKVSVIKGDVRDSDDVRAAVAGSDAVLVAIGPSRGGDKSALFELAAHNIIEAMRAEGISRIVVITAQGTGSGDDAGLSLPLRIFRLVLGRSVADMRTMENALMASDLDYTIVRPGGLSDDPKGEYIVRAGNALKGHGRTRRADLADAMARAIDEARWIREAVVVAS